MSQQTFLFSVTNKLMLVILVIRYSLARIRAHWAVITALDLTGMINFVTACNPCSRYTVKGKCEEAHHAAGHTRYGIATKLINDIGRIK